MEEQNGSSALATDRTAYSCSSKSFDERAREAASAKSFSSSPVFEIVPANTRDVTMPRDRRTSSSGVAPTKPSTANVQVVGYSAARVLSIGRGSIVESDVAIRSRASTTFSTAVVLTRATASATRFIHSAEDRLPSPKVNVEVLSSGGDSGSAGCG